jgi:hypothetical protein
MIRWVFIFSLGLFLCSCGVKGKPLPPLKKREIGIGKPLYKGVDDELNENQKKSKKAEP